MNLQPIVTPPDEADGIESRAGDIHLLDVLILFLQRRRFIFLFTAGAATLTTAVVFILPSQYTAATLILPPSQNLSLSSSLLSQLDGSNALASLAGAGLGIKNPAETYVSLFRSRTVEDAMIQHFDLMARYREKRMTDARTAFENHPTAALGTKDGLIRITVRDKDQSRALIESAATLRGQISAKEVQLQPMRSFGTENNPDVIQAKEQLSALQNQLAKLSGSNEGSGSDIILPAAGMEYLRKLRDIKYYETISDLIAKQFELTKLDEAREGATIQVADVAVPPDKRSSPLRSVTIMAATLLGFVVACI